VASSSGPITPPDYEDIDMDMTPTLPSFDVTPKHAKMRSSKKPSFLTALSKRTISSPVLSKVNAISVYQPDTMQFDETMAIIIV
jgi:hypothetical protein